MGQQLLRRQKVVRALRVRDGRLTPIDLDVHDLAGGRLELGCETVEWVYLRPASRQTKGHGEEDHGKMLWVDEDAKLTRRPVNLLATSLLRAYQSDSTGTIAGPAIMVALNPRDRAVDLDAADVIEIRRRTGLPPDPPTYASGEILDLAGRPHREQTLFCIRLWEAGGLPGAPAIERFYDKPHCFQGLYESWCRHGCPSHESGPDWVQFVHCVQQGEEAA